MVPEPTGDQLLTWIACAFIVLTAVTMIVSFCIKIWKETRPHPPFVKKDQFDELKNDYNAFKEQYREDMKEMTKKGDLRKREITSELRVLFDALRTEIQLLQKKVSDGFKDAHQRMDNISERAAELKGKVEGWEK